MCPAERQTMVARQELQPSDEKSLAGTFPHIDTLETYISRLSRTTSKNHGVFFARASSFIIRFLRTGQDPEQFAEIGNNRCTLGERLADHR